MRLFITFSLKNGALVRATGNRKWAKGKKECFQTGLKGTREKSETLRGNDGGAQCPMMHLLEEHGNSLPSWS